MRIKAEVFLPLSQGKVAVIDFDDFEKVRGMKWVVTKIRRNFYATQRVRRADGKWTITYLHRVITDCPTDMEVNHINGDGLNCKQENMQVCTPQQHAFAFRRKIAGASSKFRGVCWHGKCWTSQIHKCGKKFHLGSFSSEEDAARAYDAKARELFGTHAAPNFPLDFSAGTPIVITT